MFKSKLRPITIPQSEHARLAGILAYLWGNNQIAPPPLDQSAFAMGVTWHDRGYGLLDTMAIGEVDEPIWLATQRRGLETCLTNPIADTVALMHIRRLLSYNEKPESEPVIALAEQHITNNIQNTPYTRTIFEQADTITNMLDSIAFAFSFEAPTQLEKSVFSHGGYVSIQVEINAGHITLDPWALAVPEVRGFIMGYQLSGYPDHLQPVLVEFTVLPK